MSGCLLYCDQMQTQQQLGHKQNLVIIHDLKLVPDIVPLCQTPEHLQDRKLPSNMSPDGNL